MPTSTGFSLSSVSIVVATFGEPMWARMAGERALPSAWNQHPAAREVIHIHGRTLAESRNNGARAATGEWLVFCDADDELAPGYVGAMLRGDGDLRQPATSFNRGPVACLPHIDIHGGNFLVIGTALQKCLFDAVGGFYDEPVYEDYSLWLRCIAKGARVCTTPDAVYHVTESPYSRNKKLNRFDVMREIVARYG